jgi:diaminopimelate decarboxylase
LSLKQKGLPIMANDEHEQVINPNESVHIPNNEAFSFLSYKRGKLYLENLSLETLAQKVGTPFYAYSQSAIEAVYDRAAAAFAPRGICIFYAVKANANQSVLTLFARKGAGADVVSIGETRRALAAGIPASHIIYSGAGKTKEELEQALDLNLYQINVESVNELELLNKIALAKKKKAPVALRINPDVDAKTKSKITTGKMGNKFGIDLCDALPVFKRAASLPGIDLVGIAVHIGSQLTSVEPFRLAYAKTVDFLKQLRAKGMALPRLDLGGGLGIWYRNEKVEDFDAWADVIAKATRGLDVEVSIAPGRALIAQAGLLISKVTQVKQGSDRRFLVLDAGMNDLARPSLYGSYHHIIPTTEPAAKTHQNIYDVVGPICESTDTFALSRKMPKLKDGDLVAFLCAGAYGSSMSSTYNARPLVPEVLIRGNKFSIVRSRPPIEETIASEPKAPWLRR